MSVFKSDEETTDRARECLVSQVSSRKDSVLRAELSVMILTTAHFFFCISSPVSWHQAQFSQFYSSSFLCVEVDSPRFVYYLCTLELFNQFRKRNHLKLRTIVNRAPKLATYFNEYS